MNDIQEIQALAKAAIEQSENIGEAAWYTADCLQHLLHAGAPDAQFIAAANPSAVLELIADIERLKHFETAYKEFSDKTDWVQETAHWSELGMHRADVLRKRCNDLTSHNQAQADEIVRLRGGANTGTNTGHGHVFPRPDGVRARCGGPGLCKDCSSDLARKEPRP